MDFADWTDSRYNNQEKVKFAKSVFKKRKRNMKTNKFIAIMLLGVLATACSKDDNNRLTLLAEGMNAGDSKVQINPGNIPAGAQWVPDETILFNGIAYTITEDGGIYYINVPVGDAAYAMYPGNNTFDGNNVTVDFDNHEIVLNRLTVRMLDGGLQQMAFPMAGRYEANATNIYFYHLTAGLRLTLRNNTENDKYVASLKVVAQSDQHVENLSFDGRRSDEDASWGDTFTARWAKQCPTVPVGHVGDNGETVYASASEMNFDLRSGETDNNPVTLAAETGQVSFCIPVTITSIRRLAVTGYDPNGDELFHVVKDFGTNIGVERNRMYTVPTIDVNE